MSLVVAAIHDDDQVTMVSDTKVSFFHPDGQPDEAKTRRTYFEALPKIVLLRPDLIVGVTGDSPHEAVNDVVGHRDDRVEDLVAHLATMTSSGFVVAALRPARLWSIDDGRSDDRTPTRRAWSGDRDAYDIFRTSWEKWPDDTEVPFLLSSSMQMLTSFDPVASVGGFTLTAETSADGFRFQPWVTAVMVSHEVHVIPGQDPTRGALVYTSLRQALGSSSGTNSRPRQSGSQQVPAQRWRSGPATNTGSRSSRKHRHRDFPWRSLDYRGQ